MRLLLDTYILLWVVAEVGGFPSPGARLSGTLSTTSCSAPSAWWEIAIKTGCGRDDFRIDAGQFRRNLFDNGYAELAMTGAHAAAAANLPLLHKDPFDRMLIAQATSEGLTLVTSDPAVAKHPGPIRLV